MIRERGASLRWLVGAWLEWGSLYVVANIGKRKHFMPLLQTMPLLTAQDPDLLMKRLLHLHVYRFADRRPSAVRSWRIRKPPLYTVLDEKDWP